MDVFEMVKAAPCRNSEVPKLQVPIHINCKTFTLTLLSVEILFLHESG